jgi:hypothetical protein
VPAMTLAQLFAAENISGRAGVVKIDVEGMELPILSELVSDSCLLPARVDIIVEVTSYWYQDGWNDLLPILNAYRQAGFQSAELYDSCKFVHYLPKGSPSPDRFRPPTTLQADLVLSRH